MSEAITKACNAYKCDGGICKYTEMPWVTCSKCKGTGRIPDVGATLRAEVARLTAELDEANFARATMIEGCDSLGNRLTAAKAEIARLTAEVERLTEREREAERILSDALDNNDCPSCGADTRQKRIPYGHFGSCDIAPWLAGCKP